MAARARRRSAEPCLITVATYEGGADGTGTGDNEMLYIWICLFSFYFLDLRHALVPARRGRRSPTRSCSHAQDAGLDDAATRLVVTIVDAARHRPARRPASPLARRLALRPHRPRPPRQPQRPAQPAGTRGARRGRVRAASAASESTRRHADRRHRRLQGAQRLRRPPRRRRGPVQGRAGPRGGRRATSTSSPASAATSSRSCSRRRRPRPTAR